MTNSATPSAPSSLEKVILVCFPGIAVTHAIDFAFYGYAPHSLGACIGLALLSYSMFASVRSRQIGTGAAEKYPISDPLGSVGGVLVLISYAAKYVS